MEDFYSILGVEKTASADEIKKSYRRLASQHHPDKGGDTAMFQKIEEAYRTLGDPQARAEYDQRGSRPQFHQHGFHGPDISDIFQNIHIHGGHPDLEGFFGQFFRAQRPQEQRRNRDLRITINIPLTELLVPQKKVIRYATSKNEPSTVEIELPAGIEDGATIRYPGLGDNFFETLPRGDLYVNIHHSNCDKFIKVSPVDVAVEVKIDCWDAMLGTTTTVQGLDGAELAVKIPAGTQPGTKLCLRGQGLVVGANGNTRGNLFLHIHVSIPALKDELRPHVQAFRNSNNI